MGPTSHSSEDRWLLLIGGCAAVVGSLMGMVGNLIHPATPMGDPHGVAHAIAASDAWLPIHLAIVVGIILMLGGLVALGSSVRGPLAHALARFAQAAAIAGVVVGVILVILDGVAARQLAIEWATATEETRPIALQAVITNETLNFALASLFNILFAGVAFTLYGLAVAAGGYPRWLGAIVVVGGLESVVAGLIQAAAGEPTTASRVLTIIGPTVITLWLAAMGLLMIRRGLVTGTTAREDGTLPQPSAGSVATGGRA